jgi:hypothetical protein
MKNKTITCCCALLLCACAGTPVQPPPNAAACVTVVVAEAAAPAADNTLGELLAFQSGVRQLKPAELARSLAEPDAEPGTAGAKLRRAMLLAAQRGSGDLARAQALLDAVAAPATPDGAAFKALARFLSAAAGDARQQDEVHDKLALQVREGQRRNEQLAEKLEGLKNIERALSVRPQAPAAPLSK